ncbi:hypothetical protein V1478_009285 [Vespula squamosa]|uniref:Uncharacterized protein n=1 Tax=Vespula squamosa TaxID=30214 RepID=A0ABD2AQ32_VESSQ
MQNSEKLVRSWKNILEEEEGGEEEEEDEEEKSTIISDEVRYDNQLLSVLVDREDASMTSRVVVQRRGRNYDNENDNDENDDDEDEDIDDISGSSSTRYFEILVFRREIERRAQGKAIEFYCLDFALASSFIFHLLLFVRLEDGIDNRYQRYLYISRLKSFNVRIRFTKSRLLSSQITFYIHGRVKGDKG